jgi:hypothetical protein
MLPHAARAWLRDRDWSDNLFPALATKRLSCLHRRTASIAKHDASSTADIQPNLPTKNTKYSHYSSVSSVTSVTHVARHATTENEKATRQRGRPLLQGRIVPTEGRNSVKTFWRNLMSQKTGVSSNFWEINVFIFNHLHKRSIVPESVAI